MKELDKMPENNNDDVLFPEHLFLSSCLRIGLTMQDLIILTYVDVMKIFLSMNSGEKKETGIRKATQADIDRFLM